MRYVAPGRKQSADKRTTFVRRSLLNQRTIALDSEGVTDDNGKHHTILFGAHDGTTSWCLEGDDLGGREVYEWLHSLPKARFVGFSFSYDWTRIVCHLPVERLRELWKGKRVRDGLFLLHYTPKREFTIRCLKTSKTVVINEVFGFFQASFVKALETWGVGTEDEVTQITNLKNQRGTFANVDRATIREYMLDECRLLVALCDKLDRALDGASIRPRRYQGAGSIAAALLLKHKVKDYMQLPPENIQNMALHGYFGGRNEIAQSGIFYGTHHYDIRSAYPSAMVNLPCLIHGEWLKGVHSEWCIQTVRWNVDSLSPWPPFPHRQAKGGTYTLYYPTNGIGTYWKCEVDAAKRLYPGKIKAIESWSFIPGCEHKPFNFIPSMYQYRLKLKDEGNQAQLPIKLGLNSLYGKLAQRLGWMGKRPAFQSYVWAGLITAQTRATILSAIAYNPGAILSVATDGIISTDKLPLKLSEQLGDWEYGYSDETMVIMPGIYRDKERGKVVNKTRGFTIRDVGDSLDAIEAAFLESPVWGKFTYDATRFIGIGTGIHRKDTSVLGNWKDLKAEVVFYPSRRYAAYQDGTIMLPNDPETLPVRHVPSRLDKLISSLPYHIRSYEDEARESASIDLEQP